MRRHARGRPAPRTPSTHGATQIPGGKTMSEVAVSPISDLRGLSVPELTALARNEQDASRDHLVGALGHFVRFGEVLCELRERLGSEGFALWRSENGVSDSTASHARRLATYQEVLPMEAFEVRRGERGQILDVSI